MNNIQALLERLKKNEEIAQKFQEVEKKILSILEFKDLFEILRIEIKEQFKVPYVWFSLIEQKEISDLLITLGKSETLKEHINIIDKDTYKELVGTFLEPLLLNEDLIPYIKLLPKNRNYLIKSIAIVPISLDGEIIGSLNHGSSSKSRFEPGIDTSLLEQLGLKVSLCLSNVTAHEKVKFLAYHDPLTGLLNRRVMETVLKREFNRSKRYFSPLSVAFLDLNFFKRINDSHGHERGDDILKYLAKTLQTMTRASDVVARYAGDEFIVILPETDEKKADMLMDRIRSYLWKNPLNIQGVSIPVSVSYGIASTTDGQMDNPSVLLKNADKKLYEQKAQQPDMNHFSVQKNTSSNVINLPCPSSDKTD